MENRGELNAIVDLLGNILVKMDENQNKLDNRLVSIETAITKLATGFNSFVDFHRMTFQAQDERIRRIENRMDDLENRKGA